MTLNCDLDNFNQTDIKQILNILTATKGYGDMINKVPSLGIFEN